MAVADALAKAKHFVLGCPDLLVAVDHKPLLVVINDRPLEEIKKTRLLALKQKTLWFRFKVVHVQGKYHCGPDYMSRQEQWMGSTKYVRINCIVALAQTKERLGMEDKLLSYGDLPHIAKVGAAINFIKGIKAVTFERIKHIIDLNLEMKQRGD